MYRLLWLLAALMVSISACYAGSSGGSSGGGGGEPDPDPTLNTLTVTTTSSFGGTMVVGGDFAVIPDTGVSSTLPIVTTGYMQTTAYATAPYMTADQYMSAPSLRAGSTVRIDSGLEPSPPASGWYLYVDSGDGDKLKAISSNGTIVTIGTPDP